MGGLIVVISEPQTNNTMNYKIIFAFIALMFAFACEKDSVVSVKGEADAVELRASVEPTLVDPWQSGDAAFECGQVACCESDFHYKFDEWEGPTFDGPYEVDGGNIITISNDDGYSFSWTSVWPVSCLIVKGSNAANIYCYDPPSYGDNEMFAPTKYDKDGNPNGTFAISHSTFCYSEPDMCYEEETAWAAGNRYVKKGNWAMYVEYDDEEKTVDVIADGGDPLTAKMIGTATFSAPVNGYVTISINLTGGIFYYDLNDPLYDHNLKVQDYATKPPAKNPAPGLFAWKEAIESGSTTATITVPQNYYYGVHLDVAVAVPCD